MIGRVDAQHEGDVRGLEHVIGIEDVARRCHAVVGTESEPSILHDVVRLAYRPRGFGHDCFQIEDIGSVLAEMR